MRAGRGWRQPPRHRAQRLAAVHRRRRVRRVEDPPLDPGERLAGGHRRPAHQLFYNTGISTYVWILTNRKPAHRKGKVHADRRPRPLAKMRKSLGDKRK